MSKTVPIIDGKKRCCRCGRNKPIDCFHYEETSAYKLRSECKECRSIEAKMSRKNPRIRRRDTNSRLKWEYGITLAEFDCLLEEQNGVCKICGGTNKNGRRLAVDHNHETEKIRGLLCDDCNLALGRAKDDISILAKMINYLQSY